MDTLGKGVWNVDETEHQGELQGWIVVEINMLQHQRGYETNDRTNSYLSKVRHSNPL